MAAIKVEQVAIFGQGVANQSLFNIEFRQPLIEFRSGGIDLLHLFVNSQSLEKETIVPVMLSHPFIGFQGLFRHLSTAVKFRQFLPIANIFGIDFNYLLVILDSLGDLTFK